MVHKLITFVGISILVEVTLTGCGTKKQLIPASGEATFVETFSPSEVTILSTGIGGDAAEAENDIRYQAVNFVLFGGTDPILQRPEEKIAFEIIKTRIFHPDSIMKFISWEDDKYYKRVTLEDGRLKLTKEVRVNKRLLTGFLATAGVIKTTEEIAEAIGTPFVMVIPATTKEESPIDKLSTSFLHKKAAQIIESFLTARKYDVVVPEQKVALDELVAIQSEEAGISEDISYLYALSIGCDIYITYTVDITGGKYGTKKASVGVRIYETTTGRLLGTETGYSPEVATTSEQGIMENAFNDCMDRVLTRMTEYWKDDIKNGLQYKFVVKLRGRHSKDEVERIQFGITDIIEEIVSKSKENVISDKTIDLLIWVKKADYNTSRKIYSAVKEKFESKFVNWRMNKITINRKLIVVDVSKS